MIGESMWQLVVNEVLQGLGKIFLIPMTAITYLGNEEFYILLLPILYWSLDQLLGLRIGIMLLLSNGFNTFFKFLFQTPRPYWVSDSVTNVVHETSFGLPSGHSQNAAAIWGWLAVEVKKRWYTIVSILLILLIGVSRLAMGVHFLGDVLSGWLIGGLLVWAFSAWSEKIGRWVNRQSFGGKLGIVVASTIGLVLLILVAKWVAGPWEMNPDWVDRAGEYAPYSLDGAFTLSGTWFGMLSGFVILTEKKGRFLAHEGGWRRLARFFIGLLGVVVFYFGLGMVFPRGANLIGYAFRFFRYTLVGWWVAWLGPLVFEKLKVLEFGEKKAV